MTTIKFINEKGNVSAKVREHVKASTIAKITEAFEAVGLVATVNADKGLSIAVAQDASTGETVFAHLDFTISTRDPSKATAKSKTKTKKAAPEIELPNLFEEAEAVEEVEA